jgi:hypothetical protein
LSPNTPLPAGTNILGALSANQSVNLTQVAGNAVATAASGIAKIGVTDGTGNAIGSTSVSAVNYLSVFNPSEGTTGSAAPVRTMQVGGSDGVNIRTFATDTSGNAISVGNVASGATDSGNPVKVGAKYNSAMPTVTSGQRSDLQTNQFGELAVANRNKFVQLVGAATTTIKSGSGRIHTLCITNNGGGFSITIYDNTAGSGTQIISVTNGNVANETTYLLDAEFTTGLTAVLAGAANQCTITYQ